MHHIKLHDQHHDSATVPRVDIYSNIHKAVRAFMCDTLTRIARMDNDDAQDVAAVLAQVRELATFCASHLDHEDEFVHPAMEMRRPGSSGATDGDHVHHRWKIEQLRSLSAAVEQTAGGERNAAVSALRRCLALFVAESLTHMNMEETENNAVLWATHTDAELIAIEQAIVASIAPEEMAVCLRWMIPALNPDERAGLLDGIRQHAPAPAYEGALAIARMHLDAREWHKLAAALALPDRLAA